MSFSINVQELRERASKRAGCPATSATRLPEQGSQVATVATRARKSAISACEPLMTMEQADQCHAGGWDNAEIEVFTTRVLRFMRLGTAAEVADDLAERLTLRDREQDDRHLCLECANLMASGRCAVAARGQLPGADARMTPTQTVLMRCEQFAGALLS
jgi:hypothetical protein